jgi:hypothetical protein
MEKPMFSFFAKGVYLKSPCRLADLLAAIQVLGTYEFASRDLKSWADRLGRNPGSADDWNDVFTDHPEFFTIDSKNLISMVWRRSFKRDYDIEYKKVAIGERLKELEKYEEENPESRVLSREPLNQGQIEHLCNMAINLHEREIQHRQEIRWWLAGVVAIFTALIAVIF